MLVETLPFSWQRAIEPANAAPSDLHIRREALSMDGTASTLVVELARCPQKHAGEAIHHAGAAFTDLNGAFCSRGVHVGDHLVFNGCRDDSGCGPGQYCFLSANLTVGAPGICLDRPTDANGNPLKDPVAATTDTSEGACDPWTRGLLRYRITDVRQRPDGSQLKLEELYLPEHPIDAKICNVDADCKDAPVATIRGSNETIVLPTKCLDDGHAVKRCFVACDPEARAPSFKCGGTGDCRSNECGTGFVCATSSFGDGRCLRAPLPPTDGGACVKGQTTCPRGTLCQGGKCTATCFRELQSYGVDVFVTDPQAEADEAMHEYGVRLVPWDELPRADAIVAAVAHREFMALGVEELSRKLVKGGAFVDVKAAFDVATLAGAGYRVWRL